MIAARILDPEEWRSLEPSKMPPLFPYVQPEDIAVIVVEDDGKVIACMTVLRATHLEGAWIDPEHRNAGVTRSLLRLSVAMAQRWSGPWCFAGAESGDENMVRVLGKLGGKKLPMDTYVMPLEMR